MDRGSYKITYIYTGFERKNRLEKLQELDVHKGEIIVNSFYACALT